MYASDTAYKNVVLCSISVIVIYSHNYKQNV